MKEQLKDWGIKDATIVNASGLNNSYLGENRPEGTGENDENQMSAQDVAIVARHLILDFQKYWTYLALRPKCLAKTRNHQWKWSTGTGCSQDSLITRKAWTD